MLSQAIAVIRHVDYQRVLLKVESAQRIQNPPDVPVQKAYRSVVGGDDALLLFWG